MTKSTHSKLEKMKKETRIQIFSSSNTCHQNIYGKNKHNNENKIPALESSSTMGEIGIFLPEKRQPEGGSLSQATNVFVLKSVETKHNENETREVKQIQAPNKTKRQTRNNTMAMKTSGSKAQEKIIEFQYYFFYPQYKLVF